MEWALLFIDTTIITQFMDSLLEMVFGIAQEPHLQEWSQGVIETVADSTEAQVVDQLGYDPRN